MMKLVIALLLFATGIARAADEGLINKLFGPGPLIEGHKDLEHGGSDCLKCHDTGNGVPDNKCLSCHTKIKESESHPEQFHARVKDQACISCHSDHKGRNFNSTQVDRKSFDHAKTGFPLTGSHKTVKCEKCHTKQHKNKAGHNIGMEYLGNSTSCVSCHKKDDIHHFPPKQAKLECSACHNTVTWKKAAEFNHKRETGYELVGKHAQIKCDSCHLDKKTKQPKYDFPTLPKEKCLTCHVDQHKDNLSPKFRGGTCETCHNQLDWKIQKFDHKLTGYPLNGAHAKLPCVDCHKQSNPHKALKDFKFTGASENCVGCHKDYHGFGEEKNPKLGALVECVHCHTEMDWKKDLLFNHDRDTRYPITGKHKQVQCFECHKPKTGGASKKPFVLRTYDFPTLATKTCETCHASPHKNSPAKVFREQPCTACHTTAGWKILGGNGSGFNHNTMTKFPLDGDHSKVSCNGCHKVGGKDVFDFPNEDKKFCVDCHKNIHQDQFSTRFPADGCAQCHNTSSFKQLNTFDHDKTRFHLEGAHTRIGECKDCHTPTNKTLASKPPRPAGKFQFEHPDTGFCVDCHKSVHQGQFDEQFLAKPCKDCHTQETFTRIKPFDHKTAPFQITGAHIKFRGQCWNCHVPTNRMLAAKPPHPAHKFQFAHADVGFCEACHPSVHKQQFGERFLALPCKECHTTTDWVRKLPFDHKKTDFPLTGAHAKLNGKCSECHVKEKSGAMLPTKPPKPAGKFHFDHKASGYCEECHKTPHKDQFHPSFVDKPCRECHNVTTFTQRKAFDHDTTKFVLKGKHKEVKCAECHVPTTQRFKEPPQHAMDKYLFPNLAKDDCAACHKDPHNGSFGKKCSACHNENGWKTGAGGDFHKNFQLSGVHELLACTECHKQDAKKLTGVGKDCKECHLKDDVHMGTQPDCAGCHIQQFWSVSKFHHDTTMFPLRGMHRTLDCSACHVQGVYEGLAPDCVACHQHDALQVVKPPHTSAAFQTCNDAGCHNQFSFKGTGQ
jgi:hypothetical protein